MNIYITLGIAVGIVAILFGIYRVYMRRCVQPRTRQFRQWVAEVENTTDDETLSRIEVYAQPDHLHLTDRLHFTLSEKELLYKTGRRIYVAQSRTRMRAALKRAESLSGEDRHKAFLDLPGDLSLLDEAEQVYIKAEQKRLREEEVGSLLAAARGGDPEAFKTLLDMSERYRYPFGLGEEYICPDWNDLVARYLKPPYIEAFDDSVADPAIVGIRSMAAEAFASISLTDAQVVLAYCEESMYREAVGDVRHAELVLMVAQLQQKLASN